MIELNNVSANLILPYADDAIKKLIKEQGAKSVEDVLALMKKYKGYDYDWSLVRTAYSYIKRCMNRASDKEPEVYYTHGYKNLDLLIQDEMNYGNILLLENATHYQTAYVGLKNKTISELKADLSHTMADGKNYMVDSCNYRKIGPSRITTIIKAIEMFEEQIERQSLLSKENGTNLFILNQNEKLELVNQTYTDIVYYLISNANERLVWGMLSERQKKMYLSSIVNSTQEANETKNNLTTYITNYTTLPELEQIANHDLKVLKRFIVK